MQSKLYGRNKVSLGQFDIQVILGFEYCLGQNSTGLWIREIQRPTSISLSPQTRRIGDCFMRRWFLLGFEVGILFGEIFEDRIVLAERISSVHGPPNFLCGAI